MTRFLRKNFWLINILTIVLCTFFLASAVNHLVEGSLPAAKAPKNRALGAHKRVPLRPSRRDITTILDRNIFCSTCEKTAEAPLTGTPTEDEGQPADNQPVKTSLEIKLIATLVSEDDSAWSYAAIAGEDDKTLFYAIGSRLPEGATVTDIMDRRVHLLNNNRNEFLELEKGDTRSKKSKSTSSKDKKRPRRGSSALSKLEDEVSKSVKKIGEGKYEMERAALNKVLSNTTLLARSARIVPAMKDGKPNGFKLYAIRPGSIYSMLGMFNGDTVNAINGHPITSPDKALEVYTKLRTASHLSINFSRRGKPLAHEYTIR